MVRVLLRTLTSGVLWSFALGFQAAGGICEWDCVVPLAASLSSIDYSQIIRYSKYQFKVIVFPCLWQAVSIWGCGGRLEITPSKFMAIQRTLRPDWFQCLADGDTIAEEVSRKRAKKSVDRSLSFLDECLQLQEKMPVRAKPIEAWLQQLLFSIYFADSCKCF